MSKKSDGDSRQRGRDSSGEWEAGEKEGCIQTELKMWTFQVQRGLHKWLWVNLWSLLGFLWKESLGGADGLRWLQPEGCSQGSNLAFICYFVSNHSAQRTVYRDRWPCCCWWWCCGEGGWSHPDLLGSWWDMRRLWGWAEAWSPRQGGEFLDAARPQRMFRAHIRCDQWCHCFCPCYEIPSVTQWVHSLSRGLHYSHVQINTRCTIMTSALKRNKIFKGAVYFPNP